LYNKATNIEKVFVCGWDITQAAYFHVVDVGEQRVDARGFDRMARKMKDAMWETGVIMGGVLGDNQDDPVTLLHSEIFIVRLAICASNDSRR
jgi:hypothetical protein